MTPHGPWQIIASHEVYRDPWIRLRKDDVIRPDGRPGTHCVLHLKPGVSVLPLDADGTVCLTQEFHYGVGRETLEVVSGGIEPGEDPLLCAQRELVEELGITATDWTPLGSVDPFTSVVVSPTQLFLARGLTWGATAPEGTERIRPVKLPLETAVDLVWESRITHAPSCVLILKAALFLGRRYGD
jgi:ADP-ribose pyrophosphatase